MIFRYTPYMTRYFCCKSLDLAIGKACQGEIRTNSEASSKVETLSNVDGVQKFL